MNFEPVIIEANGNRVEYIPIIRKCTYHYIEDGICPNCENTGKYIDGYYMVINGKTAYTVDNIK